MRRYPRSILIAYALSMTIVAAWLGCQVLVFRWIFGVRIMSRTGNLPTMVDILAYAGLAGMPQGAGISSAILVASIDPANLAMCVFVIMLSCLAFAGRRQKPPTPAHRED